MKRKKVEGLQKHKLTKQAGKPDEVVFAKEWAEVSGRSDLVGLLMGVPCCDDDPEGHFSHKHFCQVKFPLATTVAQWLGTPCGMSFLTETLEKCGYVLERNPKKGKGK